MVRKKIKGSGRSSKPKGNSNGDKPKEPQGRQDTERHSETDNRDTNVPKSTEEKRMEARDQSNRRRSESPTTHVVKVGTDEEARVLDPGGVEANTVRGAGGLDPEGGIRAGRIEVQSQGRIIDKRKVQDEAGRGRGAARII